MPKQFGKEGRGPPVHSCDHCRRIIINGTGPKLNQHYDFSRRDVSTLAQTCRLFRWALQLPNKGRTDQTVLSLYISTTDENIRFLEADWGDGEFEDGSFLWIFAESDSQAAREIKTRPLSLHRAKPKQIEKYLRSLQRCRKRHRRCAEAKENRQSYSVPSRLLYVGTDTNEQLKLMSNEEYQHPEYVALSYCWGNAQHGHQTIKANVKSRRSKIDQSQLPQTIKDAITITRSLGLEYLWVDALCIVQDEQYDCDFEIAQMTSVYGGATLTISAASAESSNDGFLNKRDLAAAYGQLFQLPYHYDDGSCKFESSVFLCEHPIGGKIQDPIDRRAWTLQEHIMSLRILKFGSKQTIWNCPSRHHSIDGGGSPHPINEDPLFSVEELHRAGALYPKLQKYEHSDKLFRLSRWKTEISDYSVRRLSKSSDRLPACAAMAEMMARIMDYPPSDYLAGIWKDDLQSQLLWHSTNLVEEGVLCDTRHEKKSSPTWTWASFHGSIVFLPLIESRVDKGGVQFKNAEIQHKNENMKFSEVVFGRLWLHGRLQRVFWDGRGFKPLLEVCGFIPIEIYWDVQETRASQRFWFLEICVYSTYAGLILDTKNGLEYERVGLFAVTKREHYQGIENWFQKVKRGTVILR